MENLPLVVISIAVFFFVVLSLHPVVQYILYVSQEKLKEAQKKYIVNDKSYIFESKK